VPTHRARGLGGVSPAVEVEQGAVLVLEGERLAADVHVRRLGVVIVRPASSEESSSSRAKVNFD
jgi:hypothetical protein